MHEKVKVTVVKRDITYTSAGDIYKSQTVNVIHIITSHVSEKSAITTEEIGTTLIYRWIYCYKSTNNSIIDIFDNII